MINSVVLVSGGLAQCQEQSKQPINVHCFLLALQVKTASFVFQKSSPGTSLVAQWLRICLPVRGTRVRSLVREDPTCHGATKPVCHNY